MNAAANLTIQINKKSIGISLPNANVSIVVNDEQQNLLAENSVANLEWSKTLFDGESVKYEKAEKAVAELGEGWRLPTRYELESLLDLTKHDPAVDEEKYPDTKSSCYWTSTPCAWNDAAVWVVYFGYGIVYGLLRDFDACVRAVRSSQ
jgi:hypothetical protein